MPWDIVSHKSSDVPAPFPGRTEKKRGASFFSVFFCRFSSFFCRFSSGKSLFSVGSRFFSHRFREHFCCFSAILFGWACADGFWNGQAKRPFGKAGSFTFSQNRLSILKRSSPASGWRFFVLPPVFFAALRRRQLFPLPEKPRLSAVRCRPFPPYAFSRRQGFFFADAPLPICSAGVFACFIG
ncbi:MAG: hypothetical protein IJM93_07345 [Oscillospiraceae bacterium]|nr:hypothetical protein [Oscillospiraceae bacterium]